MKKDNARAFGTLLIIISVAAVFAESADAGQAPAYFLKSESTTELQNVCVFRGPQDDGRPTVSTLQACGDTMLPTVSPALVHHVSPEAHTALDGQIAVSLRVVSHVDPSEQLAQIFAQHEAAQVRHQIAVTAATINARANNTDELVAGLVTLWEEDQARLIEVFAVAQQQDLLLDAQAHEILSLRHQLADAGPPTP